MLDLFFNTAYAMAAPTDGGKAGIADLMVPILMMFAIIYFLMIRPQKKQVEKHRQFLEGLEKGSEVVTSGGLIGKVVGIAENSVTIEVADKVKIKVLKSYINARATAANQSGSNNEPLQVAK